MPITAELTRSIERSLDSKPVHAVAGAGDLAVEKLRELSARLASLPNVRVEPRDAQVRLQALQQDARTRFEVMQDAVRELPEQAQSVVALVAAKANDVYEELAERG